MTIAGRGRAAVDIALRDKFLRIAGVDNALRPYPSPTRIYPRVPSHFRSRLSSVFMTVLKDTAMS